MSSRHPQPGTVFLEKYRIESVIGEGGMGMVLKAHHLDLDEDVAIKILRPEMHERAEVVARFLREAKAAVKLKGEHVARVFDVGRLPDSGSPYIVMEFLDGADLNKIIKRHGSQHPAVAVDLMLQACEAIAEAHSIGIVHRDLKGSNFFIIQTVDEPPELKVLDFGMATAPDGISELTSASAVLGTPAYMAPEQISASRTADARSDIWSLGIVLYEMLEGERPFRSDVYYDLCLQIRTEPAPPLSCADLPDGLEAAILRCLAKNRDERYQTVAELAVALAPFASDPSAARAQVEQCARYARRSGRVAAPGDADHSAGHARITPASGMQVADAPKHPTSPSMATVAPKDSTPSNPTPPPPGARRDPTPLPTRRDPTPIPTRSTPTSINSSNGEVEAMRPPPRSSMRLVAIAVGALVLGGIFIATRGGDAPAAPAHVAPVSEPTPVPVAMPDPTPPPPLPTPKPEVVKPKPAPLPVAKPIKKPGKPHCQRPDQINPFDDTPVCRS